MHKVDSFGATASNEFTNGDPQLGVPRTRLEAKWMNSLQREIIRSIQQAGIALNDADDSQLVASVTLHVETRAMLRALPVATVAAGRTVVVYIEGTAASDDGGDGVFRWQADAVDADNGDTVIVPDSAPANGRWLRVRTSGRYRRTPAEVTANIVPIDEKKKPGNIRRYYQPGSVDGVTNVDYAVRKALDLAALDGTPVTCDPPGLIKVGATVYLPQRLAANTKYGYLIDLTGSTLIGQGRGIGTIFETGTGSLSTNGATNFTQPAESATSLHYGTVIKGARFRECQYAIRTFNFTKGCKLKDLYFEDLDHCLFAQRSFYMELHNCHGQIAVITAGHVLFDFAEENNAITIIGCEASGGGSNVAGAGWRFTGASSITFVGNTAEHLDKGLVLDGTIRGFTLGAGYFEAINSTAIDGTAGGTKEFTVENSWFYLCPEVIDCVEWIAGRWGDSNHIEGGGTVRVADALSECVVEIPQQNFTEAQANSAATLIPANYVLGAAVQMRAPRQVYVGGIGLSSPIVIDRQDSPSVPAFAFSGGTIANGANFTVPFCTRTLSNGSSVIDTQINWNTYFMQIVFTFYSETNGARYFSGFVMSNGSGATVHRLDADAGFTITASNNGGKLRLTVAGASHAGFTSNGFWGLIRHI